MRHRFQGRGLDNLTGLLLRPDEQDGLASGDRLANEVEGDLEALLKVLLDKAVEHRETVCIGRTHGQHALPMTYGLKFALWASEVGRHLDRLAETRKRIEVGKMSGAVGTMAGFGEKGFEVQRLTMKRLRLEPALITNQIIQRDRHAELQCLLALIAGKLDGMQAYSSGKLKVEGDVMKAQLIGKRFKFAG